MMDLKFHNKGAQFMFTPNAITEYASYFLDSESLTVYLIGKSLCLNVSF
jgi:hypothetical protein